MLTLIRDVSYTTTMMIVAYSQSSASPTGLALHTRASEDIMTKTIRLSSDDYRLTNDGEVQCWCMIKNSACDDDGNWTDEEYAWVPSKYTIGKQAVLVSTTDVSPNAIRAGNNVPRYRLHWDLDGVGGNSNPSIQRTTGWRGTTNDRSCDAHGIVTIRSIRQLKNGDLAVVVTA